MLSIDDFKHLISELEPDSGITEPLSEDKRNELAKSLYYAFEKHQYELVSVDTWRSNKMLCKTLQAIIINYSQFLETHNTTPNPFDPGSNFTLSPEQQQLKNTIELEGGIENVTFARFQELLERFMPKAFAKFGSNNRMLHRANDKNYIKKYSEIFEPSTDLEMFMSAEELDIQPDYVPHEALIKQIAHTTLQIYSAEYSSSFKKDEPVFITHFFPLNEGRRTAEHIIGYWENATVPIRSEPNKPGYFSYTSHGIGTGVYGLGVIPGNLINKNASDTGYCRVRIERPFKLYDPIAGTDRELPTDLDRYSKISLMLQEICNEIYISVVNNTELNRTEGFKFVMSQAPTLKKLSDCVDELKQLQAIQVKKHSDDELMTMLKNSIAEFNNNAVLSPHTDGHSSPVYSISGRELLPMPINYLTRQLGYDGVIGENQMNQFSRGLIKHHLTEEERERFGKRSVNNLVIPYGSYRMRTYSRFSVDSADSITISDVTSPTPILSPAPVYFSSKDRNSKS